MTERQTTTRDLGLAIRDFCEGLYISHFFEDVEHGNADFIKFVDVSDPEMPVFHLENGAVFSAHLLRVI